MIDFMTTIVGFPPIASDEAVALILGSMPSVVSLTRQQYYGHRRNAFWPIMGALIGAGPELEYKTRQLKLIEHKIALWDVLKSCIRTGSMDADINMNSILINDFSEFFSRHKQIKWIYFNGGAAEKVFKQYVMASLFDINRDFVLQRLPSTSPAYAAMSFKQKMNTWQEKLTPVLNY